MPIAVFYIGWLAAEEFGNLGTSKKLNLRELHGSILITAQTQNFAVRFLAILL